METGKLTPRANDTVSAIRFSGNFGQPDGFGSVLLVQIRMDGRAVLTCTFRDITGTKEEQWSIDLTNEQRNVLSTFLFNYKPVLFEMLTPEECNF
jgi:hypothetical protein